MKGFNELINIRQSCRNYNGNPVEREKLEAVLNAAVAAPSACNSQPWKYYVVTKAKDTEKMREFVKVGGRNKFADNCPVFAVVVEQPAVLKAGASDEDQQKFAQMDIGISVAHYCFEAVEQGLSTCIMGCFDEDKIKKYIGIPDERTVRLVIATGYASADDKIRAKIRKPVSETVEFIK